MDKNICPETAKKPQKKAIFLPFQPYNHRCPGGCTREKPQKAGLTHADVGTKTHYLTINGMTCGGCSGRVNRALAANPEVLQSMISFESPRGAVLTTDALSTEDVVAIVASTGFDVSA